MAAIDDGPSIGANEDTAQADVGIGPDVSAADAAAIEEIVKETREETLARHRYVHTLPPFQYTLAFAEFRSLHSIFILEANSQTFLQIRSRF